MLKLATAILFSATLAFGQRPVTTDQLVAMVRSSIKMKHEDKKIAAYLKGFKLTQRLGDRTIEELLAEGAGPKTTDALREMRDTSKDLPEAVKPGPKPAPVVIPPPPPEEQKKVFEFLKEYAANYAKSLPNFLCKQVTRRYEDKSGTEFWGLRDTIIASLSFNEGKEDYKVQLINNHAVMDTPFEKLGGFQTRGEFGSWMRDIFDPESGATFDWDRWATLGGKRMHVYRYYINAAASKMTAAYDTESITISYKGYIYADRDTNLIMRVTLQAVDLPATFGMKQIDSVIDYRTVDISGRQSLLPVRSETKVRDRFRLTKNEVEFRMYRKFGADETIKFDLPDDPLSAGDFKEMPATPAPPPAPKKQ